MTGGAVQFMYTEETLQAYLWTLKLKGASLRQIARDEFNDGVTYGDVSRALKGTFPKSPKKRMAFGLAPLVNVEACPTCGEPHIIEGICTNETPVRIVKARNGRTRRPRPSYKRRWQTALMLLAIVLKEGSDG